MIFFFFFFTKLNITPHVRFSEKGVFAYSNQQYYIAIADDTLQYIFRDN